MSRHGVFDLDDLFLASELGAKCVVTMSVLFLLVTAVNLLLTSKLKNC